MQRRITDWLSAQLFQHVHRNNLVYNACWEDPALDRIALELKPDDNILMITSAGCNALDYALTGPNKICTVDMNPRQNALLELKMAGIRHLDHATFFEMFGRGRLLNFPRVYRDVLRSSLSTSARQHWDKNLDYFGGRRGFYFRGTSGTVVRAIHHYIDACNLREDFDELLNARTIEEQSEIYHSRLKPALWNRFIKWAISLDASLSLVGVPRPQRKQVEEGYVGGIAKFIEDCIEAVFTRMPLKDNYFWSLYVNGHYTPGRCPEYLKRENFDLLKSGLVDRISLFNGSILSFLNASTEKFSKFVLLDHMDWLSTYHLPTLRAEWQAIVDNAKPGARLIWRSGGMQTHFVDSLPVTVDGENVIVGEILRYHRELAAKLHARDRVHTYGSFYIADLIAV